MWKHRKNRHDRSDPDFDYEAWKKKHTTFADQAVPQWVQEVKAYYAGPKTKFACVGYCFGAPYVCDELAKETVTVGAFAHPAFLKEHHFHKITSMAVSEPLSAFVTLFSNMGNSRTTFHVMLGDRSYFRCALETKSP